jgi:probable rRNA maturation factor
MLCYDELRMEINILIEEEFKGKIPKTWLSNFAKKVLLAEKIGNNIELGIVITGQEKIQELNRTYRNIDKPTDVLSFFMIPQKGLTEAFVSPPDNIRHLGEVIISYPQAKIQAKEHKHTIKDEIAILIVHGVLHLLGYDHDELSNEKAMKAKELYILGDAELS